MKGVSEMDPRAFTFSLNKFVDEDGPDRMVASDAFESRIEKAG